MSKAMPCARLWGEAFRVRGSRVRRLKLDPDRMPGAMRKALLYLAFLTTLPAQQPPDYTRDIQPIFEKNCYACHGPAQQSAGLRLDRPADAVARNLEILRRVSGAPGGARMPLGGRLTDHQIALLTTWVQTTAKPKHWAFIPPIRPAISQKAWVRNPIDAFILARLG